jgi:hypothetical protein
LRSVIVLVRAVPRCQCRLHRAVFVGKPVAELLSKSPSAARGCCCS